MNKKQIVVVAAVVIVCGYLYHLDPKALTKPKETRTNAGVAEGNRPQSSVTVATVSAAGKIAIGAALTNKINDLENQLKNASGDQQLALQKQLAAQWYDDNQPAPSAFYYMEAAKQDNAFEDWLNAGIHFNEAYKLTQDTAARQTFATNASEAFQSALKLKPASLDAKTGLGVAYVNGAGAPMQGIRLLLEVVNQDPKNINAQMSLGQFAMTSGQFEKAIDRFKTIVAIQPGFEAYFYLAESYKEIGKKAEAIAAYQKCKESMPDPTFGKRIDDYINELKH